MSLFSLLRGSGLKLINVIGGYNSSVFSLLRGSGLKSLLISFGSYARKVLPLAREWIEIKIVDRMGKIKQRSPSCEGVD